MRFNRGEIWKIDVSIQPDTTEYILTCPYVEIVNNCEELTDGTGVFAWANVIVRTTGFRYSHIPFWFQPEGATLVQEAF